MLIETAKRVFNTVKKLGVKPSDEHNRALAICALVDEDLAMPSESAEPLIAKLACALERHQVLKPLCLNIAVRINAMSDEEFAGYILAGPNTMMIVKRVLDGSLDGVPESAVEAIRRLHSLFCR